MNNEKKFSSGIVIEPSEEYGYILELWSSSTKHPDSVFYFSDYKKVEWLDDECQVYQWLLECASKLTFPFHARELVEYANKDWYVWD